MTSAGGPAAASLSAVSVRFGDIPALGPLDLDVARSGVHVVVGASGAGKTTLLRLLAGLERAATGTVALGGAVVDAAGDPRRFVPPHARRVGLVFQEYALFPHRTARENVAFGLPALGHRDADAWLDRLGLAALAHRYPAALSGGERQRVALARALATAPTLMLLDEPFSSLDGPLRARTRADTAETLRAAGVPCVLVTHAAEEAFVLGDVVSVLDRGRCVQTGTARALYDAPASGCVAEALGEANWLDAAPGPGGVGAITELGTIATRNAPVGTRVLLRPEQLYFDAGGVAVQVLGSADRGADAVWRVRTARGTVLELRAASWALAPTGERPGLAVRGPGCWVAGGP